LGADHRSFLFVSNFEEHMPRSKPQILLTNDDGILSPGLWAAAASLSKLGFVTVTAPREQSSGAGRSLPSTSDGIIEEQRVQVNGQEWTVFSVGGTPAQTVLHGVLEVMKKKPDLVVSGINYGENVASGVTISGTVGAAMEGASLGIPSMAVSLEADPKYHLTYSEEISFLVAAEFTARIARLLLRKKFPPDVDLLKVDVPSDATVDTPWQLTRVSRQRYYEPVAPDRQSLSERGLLIYREAGEFDLEAEDTDVYVLRKKRMVSVTPLSLDLTSRVDFAELDRLLRS
jgi:5'-nucleotidase